MNSSINRTKFDYLCAGWGNKPSIRGATAGGEFGGYSSGRLYGMAGRLHQFAGRCEERLSGKSPLDEIIQPVTIQHCRYP